MNSEKTPPQPSPNHSPDLESRMARLVGLEEEPPSYDEDSATLRQPQNSEPTEVQTEQPLSSNPFAKAGLVGAGTLAVVVFAGAFLTQIMSGNNNKQKVVTPTVRVQPTREPHLQQQGEEIEALKTKLALAQQANDVKAAQQQLRGERPTIRSTPRVERPVSRPTVVVQRIPAPTPTRPAYVQPRVITIERVVKVPQPAATKAPTLPQQLPVVPPSIEPSVQATPTPQPTPDPLQEWARLSKLGSYGQSNPSDKQSPSNITVAQRPISAPQPTPSQNPNPTPVASQVTQKGNAKSTVVGSRAKAKLVTAVYGEATSQNTYNRNSNNNNRNNSGNNISDNSSSSEVFVAQLTEPLKAADNSIILPKDTQLLFNVASTSEKGLMQLNVFKVSYQDKGNRIEKSVPQGALVMRGSSGGAVLGEQRQTKEKSQLASTVQEGVLGSVGQIGEEVNRPDTTAVGPGCNTTTTTTNILGYCAQQTTYPRNILGSIAQGGSKAILPGLTRRSQQAIPPRSDRNNVFVMSAGKDVELFVNKETQL